MRTPDLDRIRSEQSRSLGEFVKLYNENLPAAFPKVSSALLRKFQQTHENLFKDDGIWSLDVHRKKVMDWMRPRAAAMDQ